MNKKAFTLIELLVVVLIIGVLAAVALPQYQTAVNKSRYAGLMPLAKSVKDAEEEMIMAKGDYTQNLADLSIQVPGSIKDGSEGRIMEVGDGVELEVFSNGEQDFVKLRRDDLPSTFVMYFNKSKNFAGGIHCEAAKNGGTVDKRAKQLCESLGGQLLNGTGTSADYVTYVLEGPLTGTGSGASLTSTLNWTCEEEDGDEVCYGFDANNVMRAVGMGCTDFNDLSTCVVEATFDASNSEIPTYYRDPEMSFSYTFDDNGNPTSYSDSEGNSMTAEYDDSGNIIAYEGSSGGETESWTATYDGNSNQTSCTGDCWSVDQQAMVDNWTATYDANSNQTSYSDSEGFSWTESFDANSNRTSCSGQGHCRNPQTNWEVDSWSAEYDANHNMLSLNTSDGYSFVGEYDSNNHQISCSGSHSWMNVCSVGGYGVDNWTAEYDGDTLIEQIGWYNGHESRRRTSTSQYECQSYDKQEGTCTNWQLEWTFN